MGKARKQSAQEAVRRAAERRAREVRRRMEELRRKRRPVKSDERHPTCPALARVMKALRNAIGLSLSQVAELTGLTRQGIANLEDARRAPNWESLVQVCWAMDVRAASVVNIVERQVPGAPRRWFRL